VGPRAGLDGCEKSRPTGIRSPDRPAGSESLYRLSYPGPLFALVANRKPDRLAGSVVTDYIVDRNRNSVISS
jgi:hypothetical protein